MQRAALFVGPIAAWVTHAALPESYLADGVPVALDAASRATAATGVWMAVWWMTEAIPLPATALLPLVLLPILGGLPIRQVAAPFAHEMIFLFLGGFVVALAIERWQLHRRIALTTLAWFGSSPRRITAGFMCATAGLSMWVSNTATAVMMLPIAVSVIDQLSDDDAEGAGRFATALLLGVAYAASIGGIGTLIGTPPNLFLASFAASELGVEIGFVEWLVVGLPLVAVFLPLAWWVLLRLHRIDTVAFEESDVRFEAQRRELGALSRGEWITLAVFLGMATAWITRPLLVKAGVTGLTDAGIAVTAALVLFAIPVSWRERRFAMDWDTTLRLPWGVLLLFGGGLSLAAAIRDTGVAGWLGHQLGGLSGIPAVWIVVAVVAGMIFLTELTSNTATTASLLPILAALAPGLGVDPLLLAVPAAIAASCAFMLPVATPPNAVVFGSGRIAAGAMLRTGLVLNLIGIGLIPLLAFAIAAPWLGEVSFR